MKKILLSIFTIFLFTQIASAKEMGMFNQTIKESGINKDSISYSFRDLQTGKIVKELNSEEQVIPASTLKVLTYFASYNTLGETYEFSTKLYKTKTNDYYIVLGADPYLTTKDLEELTSHIQIKKDAVLQHLYIDDNILDNKTWGEGWQWDDDLNTSMPKFGSYNIEHNLYTIVVNPTRIGYPGNIFTEIFYPTTFINKTITSQNITNLSLSRENYISPDALTVSGEVATTTKLKVPVNHLRRFFILRLEEALQNNKISYYGKYEKAKLPANATLIAEVKHPIDLATNSVLKSSNNLVAETVFKLAGGKYVKGVGTDVSAKAMFNNYCQENNIDCTKINLVDGSGVSKNNLVTANFMTDFLLATNNKYGEEKISTMMMKPQEGTLANRFFTLQDNLYAKTGTLANISAIVGYLRTKSNHNYAFAIYITDGNAKQSDMKMLEELILREAYRKL